MNGLWRRLQQEAGGIHSAWLVVEGGLAPFKRDIPESQVPAQGIAGLVLRGAVGSFLARSHNLAFYCFSALAPAPVEPCVSGLHPYGGEGGYPICGVGLPKLPDPPSRPLKNSTPCRCRRKEAQIPLEKQRRLEPPYAASCKEWSFSTVC